MTEAAANALTDIAGISVGSAEDAEAMTGVTVVLPDRPVTAAVDVRGGGQGTRETDALGLDRLVGRADAIVLAGGSVYGLGAADCVTALLGAQRRGFALVEDPEVPVSPIVPAAVIYDLDRGNTSWGDDPPYGQLAASAMTAISRDVRIGAAGAGFGARAGQHRGGQGTASAPCGDGTVAALAIVNSFGSPYVPGTNRFWAAPFERGDEFGGRGMAKVSGIAGLPSDGKAGGATRSNTTIAVVATDLPLTRGDAARVAAMAQGGLARAIRPAQGPTDGDTVFAVSTGEDRTPGVLAVTEIGNAAADVLARAIARGVFAAESA